MITTEIKYNLHDLVIDLFHEKNGAGAAYDAALAGYEKNLTDFYMRAMDGAVISYTNEKNLYIFSRSLRPGVNLQCSVFGMIGGEYEALSHRDINTLEKFIDCCRDNTVYTIE